MERKLEDEVGVGPSRDILKRAVEAMIADGITRTTAFDGEGYLVESSYIENASDGIISPDYVSDWTWLNASNLAEALACAFDVDMFDYFAALLQPETRPECTT